MHSGVIRNSPTPTTSPLQAMQNVLKPSKTRGSQGLPYNSFKSVLMFLRLVSSIVTSLALVTAVFFLVFWHLAEIKACRLSCCTHLEGSSWIQRCQTVQSELFVKGHLRVMSVVFGTFQLLSWVILSGQNLLDQVRETPGPQLTKSSQMASQRLSTPGRAKTEQVCRVEVPRS